MVNPRTNDRSRNQSRNRNYDSNQRNNHNYPQGTDYDDSYYDNNAPRQRSRQRDVVYVQRSSGKGWIIGVIALVAGCAIAAGIYQMFMKPKLAQIISVSPNYTYVKQAYNSCHKVGTTKYVANQKDGTTGGIIGGATGAVAGGVIGNQIKQGGGGTVVGALVGGATGALIGNQVEKANQPDYIAKHGTTTKCGIAYKTVKTQSGYNVQYLYDNNMASVITQSAPAVGAQIPLSQLQTMAVAPQQ